MSTYPLSKTGARQLAAAEEAIERGLSTFMEVGSALATIRDGRLYREEYGTFEDYCKGRWGFSSRRARQLIDAVEIGTVVPLSNEAQARALGGLTPDEAIEVHGEAEKRGDTTAAGLARVKAERKPASQTHRVTETTSVTFDPETGEILSPEPAEEVAPPAGQHPAVEGSGATPATSSAPPKVPETREQRDEREAEERRLTRNRYFGEHLIGLWALLGDGNKPVQTLLDGWVPAECPMWLVDAHKPVFTPDGIRAVAALMDKLAAEWESRV